jgi:YgiT-type zinc finger domain-containing protein
MSASPPDPIHQIQRNLASWHSTHPDATFAEIEVAVEEQLERLRTQLLQERTVVGVREGQPMCQKCGATMVRRSTTTRRLLLRGDQPLELARDYVVCPTCGSGLFPPG